MPRPPSYKTSAVRELSRQLSYTPPETLTRILRAAEALIESIESERAYPEEFIVFRLTGYRPDPGDEPNMLVGEALLGDLVVFIQETSRRLNLPETSDERGRAWRIDDIAERLKVSARTLRRYRKKGLLFHYVRFDDGAQALACYESSVERFRQREPDLVRHARGFSRLREEEERQLISSALELHKETGRTRQEIARQLADRHGRSVETVRSVLAKFERESEGRVFGGRRRTRERERAFAVRAWLVGASVSEIAERLGRDALTVRRIVNDARRERLQEADLNWLTLPTFDMPEAESIILTSPAVAGGLGPASREHFAMPLIESLRRLETVEDGVIDARIAAYNYLKRRAQRSLDATERHPGDGELDAVETDLRWAALIKRSLVFDAMATAVLRIEQHLARPLAQQSSATIRELLVDAIDVVSESVETVDPSRGQRFRRVAAFAVERALARRDADSGRAGVRHVSGTISLGDPFARLTRWQPMLELKERYARALEALDDQQRIVIDTRFGLAGDRPRTIAETAEALETSPRAAARTVREAWRELKRAVARQEGS